MNGIDKFFLCLLMAISFYANAQTTPDALQLYRRGQYQDAIQVCSQELQTRNINQRGLRMNSYAVMGWSWLKLGNYQEAYSTALNARKEVRYDVRIIEIEGEALYYLGKYPEALEIFEEYVSLNEQTTGDRIDLVYYFMGEIYIRFMEFQHADIALSTALFYSPEVAGWWTRLGYAREQISDIAGAKTAYEKSLQLAPDMQEAQSALERLSNLD